jgi:hypothetical protein
VAEHETKPDKQAAEIIELVEKGKELTPAQQREYDKVVAQANDERGYEPYDAPGGVHYRILESPSHTFGTRNCSSRRCA